MKQETVMVPAGSIPQSEIRADSTKPKRVPKASTCVAFGKYHESLAGVPNQPQEKTEENLALACTCYEEAIVLDPGYVEAYVKLAQAYEQRKQPTKSVEILTLALTKNAGEPSLHYELGLIQARAKDWDAALEQLKQAHDLDPANPTYANFLGNALARVGRYDESFVVFEQQIGAAPAHVNLAKMMHHLKQDDLCEQHAQVALQLQPDLAAARELLGELQAAKGADTPGAVVPASAPGPAPAPRAAIEPVTPPSVQPLLQASTPTAPEIAAALLSTDHPATIVESLPVRLAAPVPTPVAQGQPDGQGQPTTEK